MSVSDIGQLRTAPVPINWHDGLPIPASEQFLRAVGDDYGWIGGFDKAGECRCILPYSIISKLNCRIVRFRHETIPLGNGLEIEAERQFLDMAMEYFRSIHIDMVVPAGNTALFRTYPSGAIAAPYGTYIKDLTLAEDELLAEMDAGCRKNIRRATRNAVEIRTGRDYLHLAYEMSKQTMARTGAQLKSYGEIARLADALGEQVCIFVAFQAGIIQACLVCVFSNHTAYTLYGGTAANPVQGAMHLLHWAAMCQFKELGVKRFNFTGVRIDPVPGTKQEGILTFKARFGGQLVRGYTWKHGLNRMKFAAYSFAVRLLHGGDVVDAEQGKLAGYQLAH